MEDQAHRKLRFLLLQVRNVQDPMRQHEVNCLARALGCEASQVGVFDLLSRVPSDAELDRADMLLLGGSGDYSVAGGGEWLTRALEGLRRVIQCSQPVFASCWGFQALALAAGGRVINDPSNAEIGTLELELTDAGLSDPVFGPLGRKFRAQAGHEDHVVQLPPGATLLASSQRVAHQAYRFVNRPIYCTQFHPELRADDLLVRLRAYPRYVEDIAQMSYDEFVARCEDTPESEALLQRFVRHVFP